MIIGIDFDNTIACHDESFRKVALDEGLSIEKEEKPKQVVKDFFLGKENGNLEWTRIQGRIYGTNISSAALFAGFVDFLEKAGSLDHKIIVVSHRTIFPASGAPIDLHEAAIEWLKEMGILSPQRIIGENCFFETTLENKVERIGRENCDLFIDDLTTVLEHERFPSFTKGILFGKEHESLESILSWMNADQLLDCPGNKNKVSISAPTTLPSNLHEDSFRTLLNLPSSDKLRLETLRGGGNNRSYKISTGNKTLMGKVYFKDPSDTRDRLLHENAFAKYLETLELELFPQLIAKEENLGIAVFEWLHGDFFDSNSPIDSAHWEKCFDFITQLQQGRNTEAAKGVPCASESAFSIRDHWSILQGRHDFWLRRIQSEPKSIPKSIKDFLLNDLERKYKELAEEVLANPRFNQVITVEERILSPSDFGLHNAVLQTNGSLCFYDFEYAGWDDPAKTIADFFAQPKHKAPSELFPVMKNRIIELLPKQKIGNFVRRLPLVARMANLKWCYICLNVFHPEDRKRRELAESSEIDLPSLTNSLNRLLHDPNIAQPA
ncbi:MAG: phosphotransferase [Verrucomicrobia bacterium]|nr:phosphotransferase [Verrucomicrobiota bacterium]MDA0723692.1 phosphotransferase [Verrucomicrobiota bacterium]MDA1046607.1 phosphotransferase [Verrucomicrobiota bacterium]